MAEAILLWTVAAGLLGVGLTCLLALGSALLWSHWMVRRGRD